MFTACFVGTETACTFSILKLPLPTYEKVRTSSGAIGRMARYCKCPAASNAQEALGAQL